MNVSGYCWQYLRVSELQTLRETNFIRKLTHAYQNNKHFLIWFLKWRARPTWYAKANMGGQGAANRFHFEYFSYVSMQVVEDSPMILSTVQIFTFLIIIWFGFFSSTFTFILE